MLKKTWKTASRTAVVVALAATSLHPPAYAQDDTPIGRHYARTIFLDLFADADPPPGISAALVRDFTGDGADDLVLLINTDPTANYDEVQIPDLLVVLSRTADGSMEDITDQVIEGDLTEFYAGTFLAADYDGDGALDIYVDSPGPEVANDPSQFPGNQNLLLLSGGTGKLHDVTATHLPQRRDYSGGSCQADFDGDGDIDIYVNAVGQRSGPGEAGFPYLIFNDGSGNFTVAADSPSNLPGTIGAQGRFPEGVMYVGTWCSAIDADQDGDADLVLGYSNIWDVSCPKWPCGPGPIDKSNVVLLNDGSGHFLQVVKPAWTTHIGEDQWTHFGMSADLDGDGLDDVLRYLTYGPGWETTNLQILINNGDGTFRDESESRFGLEHYPDLAFALHDLDRDGHPDIIASSHDIRINDGEGFFRALAPDWVQLDHDFMALDVDGDGDTDFLVQGWQGFTLSKMNLPYGAELDGTAGDDRLIGGAWDNVYRGLEGDDVLDGGLGNDRLDGGPGNDTLIGGKGNDRYVYHAADLAYDDTIDDQAGGADRLQFEGFDLSAVSQANQGPNGELILSFAAGGSITVAHHFQGGTSGVERLLVGGEVYDISEDPAFAGGSIESLLGTAQDAFAMNAGLNGNWWNGPARDGEGVQIEVADGGNGTIVFVATIYTYDLQGHQIFLVTVGTANGATAEVKVFITEGGVWGQDFDPEGVNETQWGTGTFTASDCGSIHMELRPNADYQAQGYTDLAYDLVRVTTPLAPCPMQNPN